MSRPLTSVTITLGVDSSLGLLYNYCKVFERGNRKGDLEHWFEFLQRKGESFRRHKWKPMRKHMAFTLKE